MKEALRPEAHVSLLRRLLRRQLEVGLEAAVHAQKGAEALVHLDLEGQDGVRLAVDREVALLVVRLDAERVRLVVVLLVELGRRQKGAPVAWHRQNCLLTHCVHPELGASFRAIDGLQHVPAIGLVRGVVSKVCCRPTVKQKHIPALGGRRR